MRRMSTQHLVGGSRYVPLAESVSVEEYLRLRALLVPIMQEVHGLGSVGFWNICLYYFVGDTLKAGQRDLAKPIVPYDDVAHKELTRWGRPERVNRSVLESLAGVTREADGLRDLCKPKVPLSGLLRRFKRGIVFCLFLARYVLAKRSGAREKRRALERIADSSKNQFLARALRRIPIHLVEDLAFFWDLDVAYSNPLDTRKMKNGLAVTFAAFAEKGGRPTLKQHGAFYGEVRSKGSLIEANLPVFFQTWGWAYEKHHIPGPSDSLEAFARSFSEMPTSRNDLLVILPTYLDKDHRTKLKGIWPELADIARVAGLNLVLRPRPTNVKQTDKAQQEEISELLGQTEIRFSSHPRFENALSASSLTISISHPATAFLQCLKVDKPVLALVSTYSDYLPEYKNFVSDLLDLRVLHLSKDSLLALAREVSIDPQGWWSGISEDRRMVLYKEHFCGLGYGAELLGTA